MGVWLSADNDKDFAVADYFFKLSVGRTVFARTAVHW